MEIKDYIKSRILDLEEVCNRIITTDKEELLDLKKDINIRLDELKTIAGKYQINYNKGEL